MQPGKEGSNIARSSASRNRAPCAVSFSNRGAWIVNIVQRRASKPPTSTVANNRNGGRAVNPTNNPTALAPFSSISRNRPVHNIFIFRPNPWRTSAYQEFNIETSA
jgi:hypothetical protein